MLPSARRLRLFQKGGICFCVAASVSDFVSAWPFWRFAGSASCRKGHRCYRYTARDGADAPLSIRTAGNVDEELFLLNMLEENYLTWPSADSPKAFVAELEHRRQILLTVRHTILANRLDPGLLSAYDDSLRLLMQTKLILQNSES